jgi:thiol:disulfide interchange protein DsbD
MLVYSTVFAVPFLALALVPQWMSQLPRSGEWLNSVKVVMGLLEIAAALKFLANADLIWHWNVFTHDVVLGAWVAIALVIALYLAGKIRFAHDVRLDRAGAGRAFTAAGFGAIALWLATGFAGHHLGDLESFLPPVGGAQASGTTAASPTELQWQLNDLPATLASARTSNTRVFIDFTGYTCTNCRWMEANMFTRPEIKEALNKFKRARLFTDGEGEMYERQQALQQSQFGTIALPLYAIVDGSGKTVSTSPGLTRDPATFLAFLNRGLDDK